MSMASRDQLTRRLDLLLNLTAWDGQLETLLRLTRLVPGVGVGVGVTLVVNGALLRGTLATSEGFARDADKKIAVGSENARVSGAEGDAATEVSLQISKLLREAETLSKPARDAQKAYFDARDKVDAYMESVDKKFALSIDDIPAELLHDYFEVSTPHMVFTLENAEIRLPGEGWIHVGFIRVSQSHISAWWVTPPVAAGA